MILYVIFGLRRESHPGQYGPEPLEALDGFDVEDEPGLMERKLAEHRRNPEMRAVDAIEIDLGPNGYNAIRNRLVGRLRMPAAIVEAER